MTEQYQQPNINLLPDASVFQGGLAGTTPIPGAVLTPLPLTFETITSPLISHLPGSSDLTFLANGRVLAQWEVTIINGNNGRSQSATLLYRDAGAGFIPFLGPIQFGYHRNIAAGAGTVTGQHQFQVLQGNSMRLASLRTAGTGALSFQGLACEVLVHFIPDIRSL